MVFLRHFIAALLISLLFIYPADAKHHANEYYRNFWNPMYHAERLNYCSLNGKACGLRLANAYCQTMGYEKADKAIIDYNVGLTHYFLSSAQCKGWRCHGFTLITCVGTFKSHRDDPEYYRSQRFVFPRFDQYRVDWCYKNGQDCGQRPAFSFCRRLGYMNAQYYKKQDHVAVTKALGNHKLCLGDSCSGFSSITCYR
jgi:hypothetical protein